MMKTNKTDFETVTELVTDYFDGLYQADVAKLRRIFHKDAFLKAPGLRRSLEEWLALVASRPIPKEAGESYDFKILAVDLSGDQAMVKVECPLLSNFYIDFLGLLKEGGHWLIVNKMYADNPLIGSEGVIQ